MKSAIGVKVLLLAGFVLCLLQVWLPQYYLTGDGPCHLYNAQIIYELWSHCKHAGLYHTFYDLVYQPDPNWLSTIVIALLMFVVNGVVAEKLFLSLYIILYISGFLLLLKKVSDNKLSYWSLSVFLLVFPLTLAKGFYNFSLSIAFYYWVVFSWLQWLEKRSLRNTVVFLFFITLNYFTHLLAFGIAAITCSALLGSYAIATEDVQRRTSYFLKNAASLALFFLPFLVLMAVFTQRAGGLQLHLQHHFYRLVELVQCKFLINVTQAEVYPALTAGIILALLFCWSQVKFRNFRKLHKCDGFLISLLLVVFIYLFFPESFLGHLILMNMRAQLFVLALVIYCIAYLMPLYSKVSNTAGVVLFSCFFVLTIFRLNVQLRASAGVADYMSIRNHIKPYRVVLPLNFSPRGKDEHGNIIADHNFLFQHVGQYLGTYKPLIILDNYEANMGYFPLRWKEPKNPYYHLSTGEGIAAGIEGVPPSADIEKYKSESNVTIDYIIMWGFDSSFIHAEQFTPLFNQIVSGYHLAFTSVSGRTLLFEKN